MAITLRDARKSAGFTQSEIAEVLNTSLVSYHAWETGKHKMPAQEFIDFALLTGVDLDSLILPTAKV